MSRYVVKIGGSNLKRAMDVARVAQIARRYQNPPVFVVSAFYGITDRILARLGGSGEADSLSSSCRNLVEEAIPAGPHREAALAETERRLERLERYFLGVDYIGEVPRSVHDAALSYGERLSSCLITHALRHLGLAAEERLPEDIGLVTDGQFGQATFNLEASRDRVSSLLDGTKIAVVPGFYGIDGQGRPTLFGRGGTDYSAAAIASCLGAEALDVYKDVDGFLSADPGAVGGASTIARLSYTEAAELSYFGAKILHPRTVEPLIEAGIPIRIFNVDKLDEHPKPYTLVDGAVLEDPCVIKCVSSIGKAAILRLEGPGVGFKQGILARVTGALDGAGINIRSVMTAQTAIDLLLQEPDLGMAYDLVKGLHVAGVLEVKALGSLAVVAAVGEGLLDKPGIAARALGAVAKRGINIQVATAGAARAAMYFIVKEVDRAGTVAAIHGEFLGE